MKDRYPVPCYSVLKEKVRNLERMLAVNPADDGGGPEGFFEADICIRDNLKKYACKANREAPTEAEAREMEAICLREIEAERLREREAVAASGGECVAAWHDEDPIVLECAAVMQAWAEAGGGIPSDDDKRAVLDRMEASSVLPCRVLEVVDDDIAVVDTGHGSEEVLVFVNLKVGDFVGLNRYRHGIVKLDPEKAMAMSAGRAKA